MSMNTPWRGEHGRRLPLFVLVIVLMGGSAYGGYRFGDHRAQASAAVRTAPATSAHPAPALKKASQGKAFVNDAFRIKVLGVKLHRRALPAESGHGPIRPKNGQFVLVKLTAKNVSTKPAIMSSSASRLVDAAGRTYNAGIYLDAADQGIERYQQPGTTAHGWIAFDVPAGVHGVSAVIVQPAENLTTTNVPTTVSIS